MWCEREKPFRPPISISSSVNGANSACSPGCQLEVSRVSGDESLWSPHWQCKAVNLFCGCHLRGTLSDTEVLPARPWPYLWSTLGHSLPPTGTSGRPAGTELRLHSQIGLAVDNDAPWLPVSGRFLRAKPSAGPVTRVARLESSQRQASLSPLYREGN